MDGLFHGKPYFLMDDLGGKPTIFGNIHIGNPLKHLCHPEALALARGWHCPLLYTSVGKSQQMGKTKNSRNEDGK